MTNTKTTDIDATLDQINSTVEAGVDIIRVSCPDKESTLALKEITKLSPVPIVAEVVASYVLSDAVMPETVNALAVMLAVVVD